MPETTNDDLARIIKEGFDGVDRRFFDVDHRFDDISKQLKEINWRLDCIENVILKDHAHRIERIEDALAMPKPARS